MVLTGEPAAHQLDLVTLLLQTTALRGNRWELSIPKPFLKPGAFHLQQIQSVSTVKLERRLGVFSSERLWRSVFRRDGGGESILCRHQNLSSPSR